MTAWRACLGRIGRKEALKMYKVKIMKPDGEVVLGRFDEPREILQLPVDYRMLSEDEKRIRVAERKPEVKPQIEDTFEDTFDYGKYIQRRRK